MSEMKAAELNKNYI